MLVHAGDAQLAEFLVKFVYITGFSGNAGNHLLKRAEAVGEFTFATAAGKGKSELEAPVSLVVGSLQRGDDGRVGLALKLVYAATHVHVVGEEWEPRLDGTGLVCILQSYRQVHALAQEDYTGGVAVDAIDAYGSIARGIAEEVNVLVGVGE